MEQLAFQNMEPKKSREEKIREAKLSFQPSSFRTESGRTAFSGFTDRDEEFSGGFPEQKKHYGLYRFVSAVLLFFMLITAFHFQFSYHGWNREKIEQVLSDDSHYQKLVKQAEMVMKRIEPKK